VLVQHHEISVYILLAVSLDWFCGM